MPIMRFVNVVVQPESFGDNPTAPKDMHGDLSLHVVRTDTGFTLFGQTKEHMLELPNFREHAHYKPKLDAIRWQAEFTEEEARVMDGLLEAFTVPVMKKTMAGMDGTTYSLTFSTFQTSLSLSWWVGVPEGWNSVADLMALLYTVAERSLADTAKPLSFQERLKKFSSRFKRR
jgi:hypothetical protein